MRIAYGTTDVEDELRVLMFKMVNVMKLREAIALDIKYAF